MAKHKIKQFAELDTFANVIPHWQMSKQIDDNKLKGKWNELYFKNDNPIVLELGCGKGEYTVNMARSFKDKNFIGVDLKGNRLWTGAKTALQESLNNVAFLRTRIENIATVFATNEVSEIWITFPDPQPQEKRVKKRLTSTRFIILYKLFLKQDGIIHLKTDSRLLYNFTLEMIEKHHCKLLLNTDDLYNEKDGFLGTHHTLLASVKTHYEKKFSAMGFKICYLKFKY